MVSEITFFLQKVHGLSPDYLTAYINFASERSHSTRSSTKIHLEEPICRTKVFQSSFFPYCIKIWNGLDPDLQNIDSYKEFKSKISPFIKIKSNSIFSVHDVYGVKLLSRLRRNLNNLNEHKFDMVLKMGLTVFVIVAQPQKQHYNFSCNVSNIKQ